MSVRSSSGEVSRIPFNKPKVTGTELSYIEEAVKLGNIAADGEFTRRCATLLERAIGAGAVLMTPSGTAALEMAAMLCDLGPDDEVLMPSFTFVSSASAVARTGARPVFVDIREDTLNIDEREIEAAIGPRTRAIMPVHYSGVGCEMDAIMQLANRHGLHVIEDAAHAVNASYHGRMLGSIGQLACLSFHETKNYVCGEGGALCVNDPDLVRRAEIIRDKGTNRQAFLRGQVDKYTWVELGSSFVPSEITCAFLCAQLERLDDLVEQRRQIWERYWNGLAPVADGERLRLPYVPEHCESNYHGFFVVLPNLALREALREHLAEQGIQSVFHYVPLHTSPMGRRLGCDRQRLPVTEEMSDRILRLPIYYDLDPTDQMRIIHEVRNFLEKWR